MMSSPPSSSSAPPLEVYLLGLVDFAEVQQLQRRLVYDLGERGGASLVVCEHPPTISVGRSGSRLHINPDDAELHSLGIKVYWVNRGGGCILHLPGQLAAYFALPLAPRALNLQRYLDGLHAAIIRVLDEFDLKGSCRPGAPGIFLGDARVATVGVAVNRWIAYHGLTLNVGPFLPSFRLIAEPCSSSCSSAGLGNGHGGCLLRQTSMEARRQRPAPMPRVREALVRQLEAVFGLERHHVFTDHPLIRRKVRCHVYAQSPG
jgi:lipoyl(octanoyl) transferase